ncbi:hypothetical protein DBV15_07374 [Temnothorax longispinosus]|uniref:Uncharacterized protein n=1 Tax=Temnothorax longispinosus TaxID=300112 RepID=A0A4S2KZV1_9HYME|nr:hypothetical protein DBV15_07374 [Temnothorax longispinosus]
MARTIHRHSSLPIVPAMEHALHHNWITRSILSSARAAGTVQSSTQTTLNSICGSNAARNYLFNFQYIRQPSNWFNRWRCFVFCTRTYNPRPLPSTLPGWSSYLLKATVGSFVTGLRLNLDQEHPNFAAGLRNPARLLTIKLGAPRPTFTLSFTSGNLAEYGSNREPL